MAEQEKTLEFYVEAESPPAEALPPGLTRGAFGTPPVIQTAPPAVAKVTLPQSALIERFQVLHSSVEEIFSSIGSAADRFEVEQVELTVTVNAEGGLTILGMGGKVGAQGGMTLIYRRKPAQ